MPVSVSELLLNIGMTPNFLGYYYAIDLILIRLEHLKDPAKLNDFTMQQQYAVVAEKYNTSSCAIERSLRTAINVICKIDQPFLDVVCKTGMFNKDKPTNKNFICAIAEHINKLNNTQGE